MNHAQNKQLHGLLNSTGLLTQKADLVNGFTGGRSNSSKDLSFEEAAAFITYLNGIKKQDDPANKMRRKMISYAHQLHWYLPNTQKINMERLDNWCTTYGYLHKKLNDYTYNELPKLVSQFRLVFKDLLTQL